VELGKQDLLAAREKLAKRLAEVEGQLATLQALTQEREILKQTIWGFDELLKKHEGLPLTGYPDRPPLPDAPLWKGARYVLRRENRPMRATEICQRLKELGWKFKGKTPADSVRTILIRKPDIFDRVEGGKYCAKE
jgi:hypothetical protein